ncbi:short-chain dehydrogenase/reductase [Rossellomorea marisflavi]|uniref:SDR family oxidoreductase n=1 Tax=Rossellomorea marisflavi TaxID=189381 RepID=UPI0025C96C8E|nr:SDR family oxidoreductase [Rossellomorea marisflavi]UTE74859.1 SDR family oxidoreductase [Rossellomorea marisflavi]GLI84147.1 short-chain dehydrogenase/reductase [Rossellomorea marisflavi]
MTAKTIVITGASSGIGKATALYFAENGWNVAATMRSPEKEIELKKNGNIQIYRLDVTDHGSIEAARDQILSDFPKVDAVLNNAGFGLMGPFELAEDDQIRKQFEVNVFGLFEVTKAFLPHFRKNKDGMFINVSSLGGRVAFPYLSLYHSTKWAVEGFTESLGFELSQLGIKAKLIEPGGVATDFDGRSLEKTSSETIKDYDAGMAAFQERFVSNIESSEPITIAKVVFEAATDGTDRIRYAAGQDAIQALEAREQSGDEAFIKVTKERSFGK